MEVTQQHSPAGTFRCWLLGHPLVEKDDSPVQKCEKCGAQYYPNHDMWIPGEYLE